VKQDSTVGGDEGANSVAVKKEAAVSRLREKKGGCPKLSDGMRSLLWMGEPVETVMVKDGPVQEVVIEDNIDIRGYFLF